MKTLKAFLGINKDNLNPHGGTLVYFDSWKEKRPAFTWDNHQKYIPGDYCISDFANVRSWRDLQRGMLFWLPDILAGSDYSGDTVTLSNFQEFRRIFSSVKGTDWLEYYGGHGTYGIAIRLATRNQEILDCLRDLENYPVIDDEKMSQLESDMYSEALEGYLGDDIMHDLTAKLYIEAPELDWDSLVLREVALDSFIRYNGDMCEPYRFEMGANLYLPHQEEVIDKLVADYIWQYARPEFPHSDWSPNQPPLPMNFNV